MAAAYGNLGLVYQTCGDLARAASMYKKSIVLFQQLGGTEHVQQVQALLDQLAVARATSAPRKQAFAPRGRVPPYFPFAFATHAYFTDPSVRPWTMKRWPTNIRNSAGSVARIDAAAICECSTS